MLKRIPNINKKNIIFVILILSFVGRIFFGEFISINAVVDAGVDDYLMLLYSDFNHFIDKNPYSLVKNMSYPFFLYIVSKLGIRYSIVLSIYWCITSIFVFVALSKITKNIFIRLFSFFYVLYMPIGYNVSVGMRVYRNSIIVPSILITLSLMIIVFINSKNNIFNKKSIFTCLLLGLFFTFTYYIKEDGIWLYCCLLFFIFFTAVYYLMKYKYLFFNIKKIFFLFLPIIIFYLLTFCYKKINKHYFGVFCINTRTEGEFGRFINNIYKIASDNRTITCWAPYDAIEKAFITSETLKKENKLLDSIKHTESYNLKGNIIKNPIPGDFLSWVLRYELVKNNMWINENYIDNFFKKVNNELDIAFKNNILKKDKRIQIISSAGGYTIEEIKKLFPIVIDSFKSIIYLKGYKHQILQNRMMMSGNDISVYNEAIKLFKEKLNMDELLNEDFDKNNQQVMKTLKNFYLLYSIINVILFINFVIINILYIIKFFKNKINMIKYCNDNYLIMTTNIILFLISLFYIFCISWFIYFLCDMEKYNFNYIIFYNLGAHCMFFYIYMFSLILLYDLIKRGRNERFKI